MSEELQSLLDRIEKDGVEKAQAKSDEIVSEAKTKADAIVKQAEADAQALLEKAEEESHAFEARSTQAIKQAARDIRLSLESQVTAIFANIATREVANALDVETVRRCITALVESYIQSEQSGGRLKVDVNEKQKSDIETYLTGTFQEQLRNGLTIEGSDTIESGFKVTLTDKQVEHDFTGTAIADALCELLQSDLAALIKGGDTA